MTRQMLNFMLIPAFYVGRLRLHPSEVQSVLVDREMWWLTIVLLPPQQEKTGEEETRQIFLNPLYDATTGKWNGCHSRCNSIAERHVKQNQKCE